MEIPFRSMLKTESETLLASRLYWVAENYVGSYLYLGQPGFKIKQQWLYAFPNQSSNQARIATVDHL